MPRKLRDENPQLPKTQGQPRKGGPGRMFTEMERLKREQQSISDGAFNADGIPENVKPARNRNVSNATNKSPNIARGRKFGKP